MPDAKRVSYQAVTVRAAAPAIWKKAVTIAPHAAAPASQVTQPVEPAMLATGLRKSFGGVEVLHGADLELRPGEVHALLG